MAELPLRIGAALTVDELPNYLDWLIDGQRDLELQDFLRPECLLGDWRDLVQQAKAQLEEFDGRLGIHGPFYDLPLDIKDPELAPILSRRMVTAVEAAAALGARQMVMHSPYKTWDWYNFGNNPRVGTTASAAEATLARVIANLGDALALAEATCPFVVDLTIVACLVTPDLRFPPIEPRVRLRWITSCLMPVRCCRMCICKTPMALPTGTGHPVVAQ